MFKRFFKKIAPNKLMGAALEGDLEVVKLLLKQGADPNATSMGGMTPLMSAAHEGHSGIVEVLLNAGADPNVKDNGGYTPLMCAAHKGRYDAAKALLIGGAPIQTPVIRVE